eukprot:1207900-Pyramimonas_sp.AAC.1
MARRYAPFKAELPARAASQSAWRFASHYLVYGSLAKDQARQRAHTRPMTRSPHDFFWKSPPPQYC